MLRQITKTLVRSRQQIQHSTYFPTFSTLSTTTSHRLNNKNKYQFTFQPKSKSNNLSILQQFSTTPAPAPPHEVTEQQKQNTGEVLYEADRKRRFQTVTAFGTLNLGWWISLIGFDLMELFTEGTLPDVGESVGFAVAPELVGVGLLCSLTILAVTKMYSTHNVGLIVLNPNKTKVMIATHTMFGNLVSREVAVNSFSKSPHPATQYYLFKCDPDDKLYTMIDREVGTFHNESRLIQMLDGRLARQISMPRLPTKKKSTNSDIKWTAFQEGVLDTDTAQSKEVFSGTDQATSPWQTHRDESSNKSYYYNTETKETTWVKPEEEEVFVSKRASQNRMKKKRKKSITKRR